MITSVAWGAGRVVGRAPAAHTERVAQLALRLTARVAPKLAHDPQLAAGFRLHDIGMIGIPISVISKRGPLTEDEVNEIQEHPWLGERIVAPIASLGPLTRQVVACHHERWDGSGYPRGLRGNEIPLAARIFAIVDVYDSMTNAQPYREALSSHVAIAEIDAGAGTDFDPEIAAEFVAMCVDEFGATTRAAPDASEVGQTLLDAAGTSTGPLSVYPPRGGFTRPARKDTVCGGPAVGFPTRIGRRRFQCG